RPREGRCRPGRACSQESAANGRSPRWVSCPWGLGRRGGARKEDEMFARVTTIQGEPGKTPSAAVSEEAIVAFRQQPGFKGIYGLADRDTGEHLGITLWETEQQAEAVSRNQGLVRLREEGVGELGATGATSKVYEVIAQA